MPDVLHYRQDVFVLSPRTKIMNKIKGKIASVKSSENISIVEIEANGYKFSALIIGTNANTSYLDNGNDVFVLFKETEVSIAKNRTGLISLNNCLDVILKKISKGDVLTRLELDFAGFIIVSIITTRSAERLNLCVGDNLEALIKSNEITLMEG